MSSQEISSEFPFQSHFITVKGAKIHYVDEGSGDPVLFLHGNPTSSYLWRNIIPHLTPRARCLAPDLIGMGKSDKPKLDYRFFDHVRYVEGFIEQMELSNITLVLHDWGSGLGFHYAMRHEGNIKGIAFMEAIMKTFTWSDFPKDFKMGFKLFRSPGIGKLMIVRMNMFVEKILPKAVVRKMTEEEMNHYREPFTNWRDRTPIWRWPQEIPINGKPFDVVEIVQNYSQRLQESMKPKLLFYASPGGIIGKPAVAWCQENLKNLKTVDIGDGIHFIQEDNPYLIGTELANWYREL
jgi:haloalkane dehalogenase